MPNETLDRPVESIGETPIEEIEEIGEAALEAVPVKIDSDPARQIHEEFPSVSPRPSEQVSQIHHETIPKAETTQSPEPAGEQVKSPEAHSLADFEELLGGRLPEDIKQELASLKAEKVDGLRKELGVLDKLREELEAEPCTSWIRDGKLVMPSLAEAAAPSFKQALELRLEAYLQTPEGQAAQKDRQLEAFAANPNPTKYEVAEAAKILGLTTSEAKLKLIPGQHKKVAANVKAKIDEHFHGHSDGLDDLYEGLHTQSPEEEKASERQMAAFELGAVVNPARRAFGKEVEESRIFGLYSDEQDLSELPTKLAQLEQAKTAHVSEILQALESNPPGKTLEALARGHITIEEAVKLLRDAEGPQAEKELHGMAQKFVIETKAILWESLPEPSLLGLDISEADIDLAGQGFDKLIEIATLLGEKPENKGASLEILREEIKKTQEQFFASIGSESDMYWHFSPFGLRIIESKQLSPSSVTGNVMTGWHSRSIHFIKPGITSMKSQVDYTGYANSELTHGTNQHIEDAFGIAVIYPLGEIAKELPYRDEPAEENHTSADTVFRESEGDPERSISLEKAYILPMQSLKQIEKLSDNKDYADIFTKDLQSRTELAEKLTKRALELAGFDRAWIEEHVLSPVRYGEDPTEYEDKVYAETSEKIRAKLPPSRTLILPISAKVGGFESHDVKSGKSGWHERLVRLETQKSTAA